MTKENPTQDVSSALNNSQAIACTLTDSELKERRHYVRTRLRPHIKLLERSARALTLNFSPPIGLTDVEEFVQLENQCCAFLDFQATQTDNTVTLNITGPEGSEPVVAMFAEGAVEGEVEGAAR